MSRVFLGPKDSMKHMFHNREAEVMNPSELKPYEKNPKKHGKDVEVLAHAIDKRGWTMNILIDQNNRIIAGHGRHQAAQMLGIQKVPVTRITVSDSEYYAIMLEDNKIASLSKMDKKLERDVMEILQGLEYAIEEVEGYSDEDIDNLFKLANKEVIDATGDFGESGEIDGEIDADARVISMTFKLRGKDHRNIKDKLTAIKNENELETLSEALLFAMSSFKGTTKTIRR